jgi:sulfide dehydrogenase [flavocytochrome c] flavoprotein chain
MSKLSRRDTFLLGAGLALGAPTLARAQAAAPRVVVIGGGWGGATAAKQLKIIDPRIDVTMVEPKEAFITCPYSNLVLAGKRELPSITFTYRALTEVFGVRHVRAMATAIDAGARTVTLSNGTSLSYDRLIVSPGISINWGNLEGYVEAAAERMPHAWEPGVQTTLLRRQLEAMPEGGTFVMSAPPNPFRCPPGPYERVSMIADFFKRTKPRAKIVIMDAKETFSKQGLFTQGWNLLYPGMIEWRGRQADGTVARVDPAAMEVETELGTKMKGDVFNIVPPQRAARIALDAGLANNSGWCPINASTMESTLRPGVHVVGDATIAGGLPKSGFAAYSQAKLAATAVAAALNGRTPVLPPVLVNTCYSHVGTDYGISVAHVVRPQGNLFVEVQGSGGVSAANDPEARRRESVYADGWYDAITEAIWGATRA